MKARDRVINLLKADNPLEQVSKMSTHEFKAMLLLALKEQDKLTRHACADAVHERFVSQEEHLVGACITTQAASDAVEAYRRSVA